jgi:hypothetical protein
MFSRQVLKPEIGREPIYDNLYNEAGRSQHFSCANCNKSVALDIVSCIGRDSHDPETVLGPDQGNYVREHFGILSKSLANGWPFMSIVSCSACGQKHLVYVAVFEPHNGWRQAVLQGITELRST